MDKKIICINDGKIFNSITEAQKFYNLKWRHYISNVINGKTKKTKNGLIFKEV